MPLDYESQSSQERARAFRELLVQLSGVFAAHVKLDSLGQVEEIHVLGSSQRNPKQIARDVQSALASRFGVAVDHRVISVAQLREDPTPAQAPAPTPAPLRLRSQEISQAVVNDTYQVRIVLTQNGAAYEGTACCRNTSLQRPKAVVSAVLMAVHRYLDIADAFQLLAVHTTQLSSLNVIVVAIEGLIPGSPPVLIGAAEHTGDEALCTVRATLDALNRRLSAMVSHA